MTENPYDTPEFQQAAKALSGYNPFRGILIFGVFAVLFVLVALFLPFVSRRPYVIETSRRQHCKYNLTQIRRALESYHDEYNALPPAYTADTNGERLHSWRTLILPFMEHAALYKQIDLSRPWDDPINSVLSSKMPEMYRCPSARHPSGMTTYLGVVGEDFCFHPTRPRLFKEISDGLSNTLMIVEAAENHAVPWMSPQDADLELVLSLNRSVTLPHPGGAGRDGRQYSSLLPRRSPS